MSPGTDVGTRVTGNSRARDHAGDLIPGGRAFLVIDTVARGGVASVLLRTSASLDQVWPSAAKLAEQQLAAGHAVTAACRDHHERRTPDR